MATQSVSAGRATAKASRVRFGVVGFALTLSILSVMDRSLVAVAQTDISRDLGFDKAQMGKIFAAFGLGYALFEIPGGYLGDWLGTRKVLMRIVIWWSFFTAATSYMWNFGSMWVTRFLFGAGEAGCFPNLTKVFSIWLPENERVRAQGMMWMAARWGGAFTPPVLVWLLNYVTWRQAFILFGLVGVVWSVIFYFWYRDNPKDHPSVNQGELALLKEASHNAGSHGNVPWKKLVSSRAVWLLWLQYFCLSYPWYFYITWLPTYLQEGRGLSRGEMSRLAILPLLFGGFGCLFCGFILPRVARAVGSIRGARRVMACTGFIGASLLLLASIRTQDPTYAMLLMGMASFFNDLVMPPAWAACMDIGGKYAGTVSGSMNMMGNLAGFTAPVIGGYLVQSTGNWNVFLYSMAAIYLVGALCWPIIDPVTPLEKLSE